MWSGLSNYSTLCIVKDFGDWVGNKVISFHGDIFKKGIPQTYNDSERKINKSFKGGTKEPLVYDPMYV